MKKKRVLHIIDSIYHGGGAQEYLLEIIEQVSCVEHFCLALHGQSSAYSEKFSKHLANRFILFSSSRWSYLNPIYWGKLYLIIRKIDPDYLHAHLFFSFFTLVILSVLGLKVPFSVSIYALRAQTNVYEFWGYQLFRNFPSSFIATAPRVAKELLDIKVPLSRVSNINITFSAEFPSELNSIRSQYGIADSEKIIVRIARFHPDKGFFELADIMAFYKTKYRYSFKLLIVGDGPARSRIEAYFTRLKLHDDVIFCGWQHNYMSYIQAADLVVCTSTQEGFGMVNIAALKCAKPFVCFVSGSLADLALAGYAHAVREYSLEGFADSIHSLLDDPIATNTASQFLLRYYEEHFDSTHEMKKFDQLYRVV